MSALEYIRRVQAAYKAGTLTKLPPPPTPFQAVAKVLEPIAKVVAPVVRGIIRSVPVVGPLVDAAIEAVFPEPPPQASARVEELALEPYETEVYEEEAGDFYEFDEFD